MAWVVTDLGTLSGDALSLAQACSSDGSVIVGGSVDGFGNGRAFRWTSGGGMVDLGFLPGGVSAIAFGVSANGSVICGECDTGDGQVHAFMWTAGGGMVELGYLAAGQLAVARAVSADGTTIVGQSSTIPGLTPAVTHPCYWISGGAPVDIGLLAGNVQGTALGVSSNGQVIVGGSGTQSDAPWVWTTGGGLVAMALPNSDVSGEATNLATSGAQACGISGPSAIPNGFLWNGSTSSTIGFLAGTNFNRTYGISGDGTVIVGNSFFLSSGVNNAYYWTNAGGFIALPELGGGSSGTTAFNISSDGAIVVGQSDSGAGLRAVYWSENTPPPPTDVTEVAELWFGTTLSFVDLTVAANRRKWLTAGGGAADVGANGQNPFGSIPAVYLTARNSIRTFPNNAGSGGAFISTGTVIAATSNPPPGQTIISTTPAKIVENGGVLGDYRNGNLYAFNETTFTDNGTPRLWLRRWRALPMATMRAKRFSYLAIQMQTGAGMVAGALSNLMLRWSDDNGHTWNGERIYPFAQLGQTAFIVKFNRLGQTRRYQGSDRIFELSSTDPFKVAILDATVKVS